MVMPEFVGHTLRHLGRKNGMQYGRPSNNKLKSHSAQQQVSLLENIRKELTPYLARYTTPQEAADMRHRHLTVLLRMARGLTSLWKSKEDKKGGARRAVEAAGMVAPKASQTRPFVPEKSLLAMYFHDKSEEKKR